MRVEIMRWVRFITLICPLLGLIAIVAFLLVFYRPLCRILEQFNCRDVLRIKIGPIEIEKQPRSKPTRTLRRKEKYGCGTRGDSTTSTGPQRRSRWSKRSAFEVRGSSSPPRV